MGFYAIGIDPTEPLPILEQYKDAQGHTWPVTTAPSGMLPDYRIITQSTKVTINAEGVIAFRAGYGVETPETWHQVFQQLSSG